MTGFTKITLYHASWCPHCTTFMSEWQKLKTQLGGKVQFEEYEDGANKDVINANGITGFPTIKLDTHDGKKVEYSGPRTADALIAYMQSPPQSGGAKNNKIKYFKYKAKYMRLKALYQE